MFVVLCNCPPDRAAALARAVVDERLAACVNIVSGVQSVYRWQGEVCQEPESTLLIKAGAASVDALRERLVALHPYDVPEVVALPVDVARSHGPYVDWVRET